MDYMVYVENSNDRFSLLDMIEKDCEALDSDEKWRMCHTADIHADKNKLFSNDIRQSQLSETFWTDSCGVKTVPSVQENAIDAAAGVNRDPHLLVNPRTVAPVLENESAKVAVSAISVIDCADAADVSFTEVEPSAKIIKIEPVVNGEREMLPTHAQIVSLTNSDQGTTLLAPAPVSSSVGTMQLIVQVASSIGNLMQTGGNVCFVVEPQTLVAPSTDHTDDVGSSQFTPDVEVFTKDEAGSEAYEKPVFSYSCLIAMALKNSDTGSLPVNEIYAYILEKFPYFKSAPDGWKNSIRHNLSLNKCFEKIENPTVNGGSRKGCLWGLNPAKADKMDEEISKWIKRASKSSGTVNGVSGENLADCPATVTAQNGVNITDEYAVTGPSHVTCADADKQSSCPTAAAASESEYFTMLEDSFSSDPMLAGLAVQNGLWDDLTETDELMSTAMSFSGSQLAARTAGSGNGRVKKNAEPQTASTTVLMSSTSTTCRSYHSKAGNAITSSGRPVDTSDVIIISQPAIG